MRHRTAAPVLFVILTGFSSAQPPRAQTQTTGSQGETSPQPQEILLWPAGAPGALGDGEADKPSITWYPASRRPSRTGVIVAPGGAYGRLASDHEGRQVAAWFNAMGVTAFVLKYRVGPRYHHPIEMGDAQRA